MGKKEKGSERERERETAEKQDVTGKRGRKEILSLPGASLQALRSVSGRELQDTTGFL